MKKIKLIATDIDGTLFDSKHHYDKKRLNNYLDKLHQQNVKFAVASGNNRDHLEKIFTDSPKIDLFIAENGSQIYSKEKTLYEKTMPKEIINSLITSLPKNLDLKAISLSGKKASYAETSVGLPLYHINNLVCVDDLSKVQDDIFKINIQLNHTDLDDATKFLNDHYQDTIYAAVSGFGTIDIMSPHINKAIGLKHLCELENISLDNVLAFGDNTNDLEMIKESGIGVAMKNAKDSVKEAADRISHDDNEHDGVLSEIAEIFDFAD
ncbi:HAD family hydrolase [Companilactobacillus halodurans]|uniref:HAD family phosphatase n=1 Tax=Companilactobacillus halodurans TaxID=2584183 RepID=A0A5P0ZQC9_9LACO|nr:HAD family hydrolase [Companilactobacillus halodurans]MQS76464.1 HAD family phosphatase [Companilactobacillus halodurans]MQS97515.1 HAD family phosphatase [Companilactobacillus halodurans]